MCGHTITINACMARYGIIEGSTESKNSTCQIANKYDHCSRVHNMSWASPYAVSRHVDIHVNLTANESFGLQRLSRPSGNASEQNAWMKAADQWHCKRTPFLRKDSRGTVRVQANRKHGCRPPARNTASDIFLFVQKLSRAKGSAGKQNVWLKVASVHANDLTCCVKALSGQRECKQAESMAQGGKCSCKQHFLLCKGSLGLVKIQANRKHGSRRQTALRTTFPFAQSLNRASGGACIQTTLLKRHAPQQVAFLLMQRVTRPMQMEANRKHS